MPTLAEIREKYPQYKDMSDDVLADKLYAKHYSDMPRSEFDAKVGAKQKLEEAQPDFVGDVVKGVTAPVRGVAQTLKEAAGIGAATAQQTGEGVKKETKAPVNKSEDLTPGYVLGSMLGPAGLAGSVFKIAPKIITPMTRNLIAGGVGAGVQPVPEGGDFWGEKARQVKTGLAVGYGMSIAGKAVGKGVEALGDWLARKYPEHVMSEAISAVLSRINADNKYGAAGATDMLELIERARDINKPMVLADFGGPNLGSLGGRVARSPGGGMGQARSLLEGRDRGAPSRLRQDIGQYVFSGPSAYQTVEALLESRSAAANPLYRETDALQGIWSPRLQEFLDNPDVARGMARGYRLERNKAVAEGRPFDPTQLGVDLDAQGNIVLLRKPNMRVLDMGKQGLDAMIAEERNPITGRLSSMGVSLDMMRRSYLKTIDSLDTKGVYARARDAWGGPSASMDAVRAGRAVFGNSPEENAALVDKLKGSDKEFLLVGMADIMRERLSQSGLNSNEARALIRNEWQKQQMRPFFRSEDDFNRFVDAVTSEQTMAETKNSLIRGSQTAERGVEEASPTNIALRGLSAAKIGVRALQGHVLSATGEAWRLWRDIKGKSDPQIDEAIAKIIFNPDITQTDIARRLAAGESNAAVIGNILTEPVRKAQDVGVPALTAGVAAGAETNR